MSNEVPTKSGNPYHDEKTGQFTSAGLSALRSEIFSNSGVSEKLIAIGEKIKKSSGKNITEKVKNFLKSASNNEINTIIDECISIPSLLNSGQKYFYRDNVKENHNRKLDYIGVDLICYDNNINWGDHIWDSVDVADVKTTYGQGIELDIGKYISGHGFSEQVLLNPNVKVNNKYILNFLSMDTSNPRELAEIALFHDFSDIFIRSQAVKEISKKDLFQKIYEFIKPQQMKEVYQLLGETLFLPGFKKIDLGGGYYKLIRPLSRGITECISYNDNYEGRDLRYYIKLDTTFFDK